MKQPGGADLYDVEIKYIPGHNPDLVISRGDDGYSDIERIDLTHYKSQEALHGLFKEKGIARKADAAASKDEV